MSEENNQELAAPESTNAKLEQTQILLDRIEALERKNKEIRERNEK